MLHVRVLQPCDFEVVAHDGIIVMLWVVAHLFPHFIWRVVNVEWRRRVNAVSSKDLLQRCRLLSPQLGVCILVGRGGFEFLAVRLLIACLLRLGDVVDVLLCKEMCDFEQLFNAFSCDVSCDNCINVFVIEGNICMCCISAVCGAGVLCHGAPDFVVAQLLLAVVVEKASGPVTLPNVGGGFARLFVPRSVVWISSAAGAKALRFLVRKAARCLPL